MVAVSVLSNHARTCICCSSGRRPSPFRHTPHRHRIVKMAALLLYPYRHRYRRLLRRTLSFLRINLRSHCEYLLIGNLA